MEANKLPHEEIEKYLLGDMKSQDRVAFEQKLTSDPALQAEMSFQKEIITGIGQARKMALKSRLAEVPVSASLVSTALNSSWVKLVSGVVIVSTVSVATYFMLEEKESDQHITYVEEIGSPVQYPEPVILQLPQKVAEEIVEIDESTSKPKVVIEKATVEKPAPTKEIKAVQVVVPEVTIPEPETEATSEVIEEEYPFVKPTEDATVQVNIESAVGQRTYKYFDGVLTLRGDFEGITYDLLEINNKAGKQYYLEIESVYYALPVTPDFRTFIKIDDQKLIQKLELLRNY